MLTNRVMLADSYKYSHSSQYPKNMIYMYDYMESRGGKYPATVFFGLQYYLIEYFSTPINKWEVDEAHKFAAQHGVPFDIDGWNYIVDELHGRLPVLIKAVPEGSLIPVQNVLMSIESTDPKVPWIAGWMETILMKIWYPTTIATKSYYVRQMLEKYGSPDWAKFAYHNFGDRGSTSIEAAAIGGMAHLTQFMGTDNFNSLVYASNYYDEDIAGFSVFATEHSTTTSYGRTGEEQFVLDQLRANPDAPIMSFVADSYDVFEFTNMCTHPDSEIRKLLESRPHQKLVLRPDSGNPIDVIERMLLIMMDNEVNTSYSQKGLQFENFGILWGDGITPKTIEDILSWFTKHDSPNRTLFAAENFVFGSGGDLMQNVTRDTQKFAIKCSSITVEQHQMIEFNGIETYENDIDVFKDPITDPGKKSKKGRVTTYYNPTTSVYFTDKVGTDFDNGSYDILRPVYENGNLLIKDGFNLIRDRS